MSDQNVVDLPMAGRDLAERTKDLGNAIALMHRWRHILSVRWLVIGALAGAIVNWTVAVSDPTMWRFVSAAGYSAGVLIPVLVLYYFVHRSD